jgi:probable phosphoglycerate mutase
MKIYVIRHGLTGMNKQGIVNGEIDEPLAEEGIVQARKAADSIPGSIRYVYVSPLQRAVQTAKLAVPSLPLSIHQSLSEIRMGSLAGLPWDSMPFAQDSMRLHRTLKYDYTSNGGESVEEVTKRTRAFIADIEAKHADGEVLLVTHGGIIRILKFLETGEIAYDSPPNASIMTLDTTNILYQTPSRLSSRSNQAKHSRTSSH